MKAIPMKLDQNTFVWPKALRKGDTIGIVAPSSPFDEELFDQGLALIREMGFGTKIDAQIHQEQGYLAGDDRHRAAQFNAMMADDEVQAVMCARGGYGALRILELLDYDAFKNNPKPLIGFSDVTALHQAIHLKTGMITFHGPMATTLARSDNESRQSWYDALTGALDLSSAFGDLRTLKNGVAEGFSAGGNLATLCHMVGTPWAASLREKILIIEDVGEAPYRIDRMLTQMKMAGALEGISGLVVGDFTDCGSEDEIDALIKERFEDFPIPIVSGAPVGHGKRNLTVPLGAKVRLDADKSELCLV